MSNNINNFVNMAMFEYASIFPTVIAVLDQVLFTVGNGYDIDHESGMPYNIEGGRMVTIDKVKKPTKATWAKLRATCLAKEARWIEESKGFHAMFADIVDQWKDIDYDALLVKKMEKYKENSVTEQSYTIESLYEQLVSMEEDRKYIRPYPLSGDYSDIFNLNNNTPVWFLEIAANVCDAWVKYLGRELILGHCGKAPSWEDPENTGKHRIMLIARSKELREMIEAKVANNVTAI